MQRLQVQCLNLERLRAKNLRLRTKSLAQRIGVLIGVAALAAASPVRAADLKVVATIKPIHALAAAVMRGAGSPRLLIDGAGSPHTFTLKPSDAKVLSEADVFLRVSEALEPFTGRLVGALPKAVRVVTLEDTAGLTRHRLRTGATFEADAHDSPAAKDPHGQHGLGHQQHRPLPQADAANDGHIWLDPANARLMAAAIAEVLAQASPAQAPIFRANAASLDQDLERLDSELATALAPVKARPYIVFHDAYQYLERRYGLQAVGSVTLSPDVPPSARRLTELRRKIADLKAACVFSEPQFTPKIITTIIEGTAARRGTLDPLGAAIPAGPEHYFTLLRGLASGLNACLADPA